MRLLPLVKGTLQKFKGGKKNEENEEEIADGFHKTPPGEFPRNGPRSSIVAIVMFYVSKIVTIIGLIMVARAVWFEEVGYLHFYWFWVLRCSVCGGVDCVETIFGGIGCGYVVFNLLYYRNTLVNLDTYIVILVILTYVFYRMITN